MERGGGGKNFVVFMSSSPSFSYSFSDNPLDPESGVLMPLHIDLSGTAAGKFLMCQPEGGNTGTYVQSNKRAGEKE